jgi:dihydrofolate synthase/folylpolyglutamate synthase
LHPRVIDLSLGRIERLLDRLDRPQDRLPPVFHVAGTNGKGSVIAFVRGMLEAQGLRVHVFTSPHLVRFNERIVVSGEEIDEAALIAVLEECEAVNGGEPITFFEITTAAALLAFAREPADLTLLETGLGGRLDATNVVQRPALTAITPISVDHQSFLGETLGEIAFEKAGILKPRVACVVAAQRPEAASVIRDRADTVGAPLVREGIDWSSQATSEGMIVENGEDRLSLPRPGLSGVHQIANAGLALACIRRLPGVHVGAEAVRQGLEKVRWPGRLQRLDTGRLRSMLPGDWELWLDGGHNPAAGEALAVEVRDWRDRPVHVILGMLRSKDAAGFVTPLAPFVGRLITIAIPREEGSLTAEDLVATAATAGLTAEPAAGLEDAFARLTRETSGPARVLVCGSLYLAGVVLKENGV